MFQCEDGNFEVVLSCHSLCVDNVKSKGAVRIAFCSDALWSLSPSNLETPLTETEGLDEAASQDAYEVVLEDALLVLGKLVKGLHAYLGGDVRALVALSEQEGVRESSR